MMPTIAAQQVSSPQPRASRCHAAFTRSSSSSSPLKTCGDATTTATSSSFPVHHEDVWNVPSSNNFVAQLSTGPRPRPGAPHVALPCTSCAAPAEGAGRSYLTSSCFPPRWSTMTTVSPMYAAPPPTRHDEADDDDDEPRLHHFGSRAAPHRGMEEMALRRSSLDEMSKDLPQVEGSAASTWSSTWRLYSHTNTSSSSSEPSTIATPTKAARADDDGAVLVAWRCSATTNQHLHNNVKDEVDAVAHDDAIPGVMAPAARRVLLSPPKEESLHECFSECRVAPSNACRRHLHLRHKDPTTCHEDVEMHACFFGCDESDELLLPRTEAMTAYLQAYYAAQLNLRHLPRVHVPPLHLHKKEGHDSSGNGAQPELADRLRVGGPVVLISPARDEPMPVRCTARGRAEVMDDEVHHDVGTPSLTAAEQEHLNAMGWF